MGFFDSLKGIINAVKGEREGDNVGIFLSGVAKNEVRRGFMIMKVN